jgi:hypothetical protein
MPSWTGSECQRRSGWRHGFGRKRREEVSVRRIRYSIPAGTEVIAERLSDRAWVGHHIKADIEFSSEDLSHRDNAGNLVFVWHGGDWWIHIPPSACKKEIWTETIAA